MTLEIPEALLEKDLVIRPVGLDDVDTAVSLFNHCALLEVGVETNDAHDRLNEWQTPGFHLDTATQAVFTPEGQMIAYAEVSDEHEVPVRPIIWGRVHPDYRGGGLGTLLMDWSLRRARQAIDRCPPDARVVAQTWTHESAADSHQLLADFGFTTKRSNYQMFIEMTEAPPAPQWPHGIIVRTFDTFQDLAAVYRAHLDAFQDHRGFISQTFEVGLERFRHWMTDSPDYDPTVWFLAMDGDEIAGYSICLPKAWDDKDKGFVEILGVRRPYRRNGLGLALLHHTFTAFWERGIKKVGLGVDSTSITNAVALYERAGMRVLRRYHLFEKELRPGVEYSKQ